MPSPETPLRTGKILGKGRSVDDLRKSAAKNSKLPAKPADTPKKRTNPLRRI